MNLNDFFLSGVTNQSELAKAIGVHAVLISQWTSGVRRVPAERCPAIERATRGKVRCEDMRPDVDWSYLRGTRPAERLEAAAGKRPAQGPKE